MPRKLHFIHGSTAIPPKPELFEFRLFNYIKNDNDETIDNANVHNGVDAFGPGIYTQIVEEGSDRQAIIDGALAYVGKGQGGSIMGFNIDMEPNIDDWGDPVEQPAFTNDYPPDHISVEEWTNVIQHMVDERRRLADYHKEDAITLIEEAASHWDETGEKPTQEILSNILSEVSAIPHNEVDPNDFDSPDAWLSDFNGAIELYDPSSRITDEGGPEELAEYAINTSYDLRETLNKVYNLSATETTGKGTLSFNAAFQFAVINNVDDLRSITVAKGWSPERDDEGRPVLDANGNDPMDNGVYIVFNTSEANIDFIQKIEHSTPHDTIERIDGIRKTLKSNYDNDLNTNQLSMKLQDEVKENLGISLSEGASYQIMSIHSNKPLYKGVIDMIHEVAGETTYTNWEKRPGAKDYYLTNQNEPSLNRPKPN